MRMKSWRSHPALADCHAAVSPAPAVAPTARRERPESPHAKPKPARITRRACLCCGQEFTSEGIHNRLCGYCRRVDHQRAVW
ncbi:MAG: hypothetical protein V9G18_09785 [Albidovulum sp.]|jgi:hypothetical protein